MTRSSAVSRVVQCSAALAVGAAAGFVIVDPASDFAVAEWGYWTSSWGGWRLLFTAAPGVVVVVATLTAMALTRARQAWAVVAASFVGILIASGPVLEQAVPQLAQRYSVVGLAGVALGAAAAAVWPRRAPATCLLLGAAAGLLLSAAVVGAAAYEALPRHLAEYFDGDFALSSWWRLPAAAAILALAAAVTGGDAADAGAVDRHTRAAAGLVAVGGLASYALADVDSSSLVLAVTALLLTLVVFAAAAWLLPGRDGRFLLAVLAVSAVTAPVVLELSASVIPGAPVLVAAAALIGAGGYLGSRFPAPALGLAGLIVVAALGVPAVGDPTTLTVVRLLLAALSAGYLLASSLPERAASGAVGAAGLFAPTAWSALSMTSFGTGWSAYTPLTDAPSGARGLDTGMWDTGGDGAFLSNVEFSFPALSPGGVSAAMVVMVLAAGAGMSALSRRQP